MCFLSLILHDLCNKTMSKMAAPLTKACLRLICFQSERQSLPILVIAQRNRTQKKKVDDFFGIDEDQCLVKEESTVQFIDDETKRTTEMHRLLRSLSKKGKNKEAVVQTYFGQVRFDSHARQTYKGDIDPANLLQVISSCGEVKSREANQNDQLSSKSSRRMKKGHRPAVHHDHRDTNVNMGISGEESVYQEVKMNYFDEQYFDTVSLDKLDSVHSESKVFTYEPQSVSHEQTYEIEPWVDSSFKSEQQAEASDAVNLSQQEYGESIQPMYNKESIHVAQPAAEENLKDQQHIHTQIESQNVLVEAIPSQIVCGSDSDLDNSHNLDCNLHANRNKILQSLPLPEEKISTSHSTTSTDDEQHIFKDSYTNKQSQKTPGECITKELSSEQLSFIDAQYFSGSNSENIAPVAAWDGILGQNDFVQKETPFHVTDSDIPSRTPAMRHEVENHSARLLSQSNEIEEKHSDHESKGLLQRDDPVTHTRWNQAKQGLRIEGKAFDQLEKSFDRERKVSEENVQKTDKAEDSAYKVAMKIRRNLHLNLNVEAKVEDLSESKKRVLKFKEQVPDIYRMPAAEVVKLLADNIIFENDDFIAVDKPYGLPSHGGPGVHVSVGQVLEPLSRCVDRGRSQFSNLHLVHRLDKETTGVMLLAKRSEVAWQLVGMFRRREVGKTYWTVTKGLPQPKEGVIDIPLARQNISGKYKTIVRPKLYVSKDKIKNQKWSRRDDRSFEAITQYQVLAHHDSMALVECRPLTGLQHQIRAHLAQALNTPVLGDHKYSHFDRLAPQKLFPEALQKLGIRQAQVRYIPLHLHAKELLLPEWQGKHNVFIRAGIPKYFLSNLKTLKIKIPSKKD